MENFTEYRYDPINFTDYNYFENLLYTVNNCPTSSVEWSLDGKYLKINYRQFVKEYLTTGPMQCENVFSFINNMERCGFRCICRPYQRISTYDGSYESERDELVFVRQEEYDYHYDHRRNLEVDYEDMSHNTAYTKTYFKNYSPCYYNNEAGNNASFLLDQCPIVTDERCQECNPETQRNPSRRRRRQIPKRFRDFYLEKPAKRCRSPRNTPSPRCFSSKEAGVIHDPKTPQIPKSMEFEDFAIFENPEFRAKFTFHEEGTDDTFMKETSRDVMWCGSSELGDGFEVFDNQPQLDGSPSFCICPIKIIT